MESSVKLRNVFDMFLDSCVEFGRDRSECINYYYDSDGVIMIKQNTRDKEFLVNYSRLWTIYSSVYLLNSDDIRDLLSRIISDNMGISGYTIGFFIPSF